ncbi:hypothetical protein E2C01_076236 [Portunus trituberculatus]|uniref:Uncharacterized protein n=1 Tax=Portunus trituberculatus TaxID=210409 RepID=A0A5B7IAX9_PORTR|nr:hypothetical protein [Portunus trituberculatus]
MITLVQHSPFRRSPITASTSSSDYMLDATPAVLTAHPPKPSLPHCSCCEASKPPCTDKTYEELTLIEKDVVL